MQPVASFSGRTHPVSQATPLSGLQGSISHVFCRRVQHTALDGCHPVTVKGRFRIYATPSVTESLEEIAPLLPGGKDSNMVTVGDVMTAKQILTAKPNTTINEALEILVHNSVTGLPVIDEQNVVVGVVSDFDLLSLDHISGERETAGIFPDITTDWKAFEEVQKLILKNHGSVVEDVMTPDPITISKSCTLEKAARTLLDKRIRRLPVVDSEGRLEGMFSRADVIKAALRTRKIITATLDLDDEDDA